MFMSNMNNRISVLGKIVLNSVIYVQWYEMIVVSYL